MFKNIKCWKHNTNSEKCSVPKGSKPTDSTLQKNCELQQQ